MWIANQWKDYEIVDTTDGEKLERWGEFRLIRPDPQVIWHTDKTLKAWQNCDAHYHRSARITSYNVCYTKLLRRFPASSAPVQIRNASPGPITIP